MAEYIDIDAQVVVTDTRGCEHETTVRHIFEMNKGVYTAADVVERKTGKWIFPTDIVGFGRCSECKALWDSSLITNKFFNICPRCGSYNGGDEDV